MTKTEKKMYVRAAQKAMKENGMKVFQKDIILLETGMHAESVMDTIIRTVDYVMFECKSTGKQYQCYYGPKHYNAEKDTLWVVEEYTY